MSVERSLRGSRLEYCTPEYLASLSAGVRWVLVSVVALIVEKIAWLVDALILPLSVMSQGIAHAGSPSNAAPTANTMQALEAARAAEAAWFAVVAPIIAGIGIIRAITMAYGWWRLTTPDPEQLFARKGNGSRRVIRTGAIFMGACICLQSVLLFMNIPSFFEWPIIMTQAGSWQSDAMMLVGISTVAWHLEWIIWFVVFFVSMTFLCQLAPRIPSARIHAGARRMRWLFPLVYFVGFLCIRLGPIAALVLYYHLFNLLRIALNGVRAKVASAPAASD